MTVKGLLSHFSRKTTIEVYNNFECCRKHIKAWNGIADDVECAGSEVSDWYVNNNAVLIIVLKEVKTI